jgi:hypothetical protein
MSAFEQSTIENYWIRTGLITTITFVLQPTNAIGEYPLLNKQFPEDHHGFDEVFQVVSDLLSGSEVSRKLVDSVTFSECAHFVNLLEPLSNPDPGMV